MDGVAIFSYEIKSGCATWVGYGATLELAKKDAEFKASGGLHTWISDPKNN